MEKCEFIVILYYILKNEVKKETQENLIYYAKAIFDDREVNSMLESLFNGWLGLGPKGRQFTDALSSYLNAWNSVFVNSGSSANLIAIAALKSKKLHNHLNNGDEILTPAVTFPTTFNPIIQNNLVPVLIDVDISTYNIDIEQLKETVSSSSKGIMIPHTLGNPNDMRAILDIVEDNNLFLIEDNCDALGSKYNDKMTGTFGVLSTVSFYPAHHITTGEGGAVVIPNEDRTLHKIVQSIRDWGRDCWCDSDTISLNGACNKRFDWEISGIPYDHRYIYSHVGYNLKPTELQAAMGVEQLKRLDGFVGKRQHNFYYLYDHLLKYSKYLHFMEITPNSNPSWFCFPIRVDDDAPFSRNQLIRFLEKNNIQTRLIFAGNILKQPAYQSIPIKIAGPLTNSDKIMENSFFIGVHPSLETDHLNYVISIFEQFMRDFGL